MDKTRANNIKRFETEMFDVLVLGGGINGAVAAAALSKQGAKVALIDKSDFASYSSSNSSNLAWGGIKYLESGELFLVRKLCLSRNHLMEHYPSRVKEIRFYASINKGFRWPAWFIYLGALFYWFIGLCKTEPPRFLRRSTIQKEEEIINAANCAGGVEYSDCYLPGNDARFVFGFIRAALRNKTAVANYIEATGSVYSQDSKQWTTSATDQVSKQSISIKSKAIVNACGGFVDQYNQLIGQQTVQRHVFSKGVHLIVKQLTPHNRILAFFASDGRLFFVIPMGNLTCIGTTDTPVETPTATVSQEDRDFILHNANQLLKLDQPLEHQDIIAERCGVRPLVVKQGKKSDADWLKLSRKHAIHTNSDQAYLSIFGGKITDCINVGNEVVDLCEELNVLKRQTKQKWYGEPLQNKKQDFLSKANKVSQLKNNQSFNNAFNENVPERWWRRFGEGGYELLSTVVEDELALIYPLPQIDYCRCEIAFMGREEMIVTLDDFLRRRTKIAMLMPANALLSHPGLREIAVLLFGEDKAESKIQEYKELNNAR